MRLARYIFVDKEIALEKKLISKDTVRMISKDGKRVCLLEDDLLKMDGDTIESKVIELEADMMDQRSALKVIQKEFN